MLIIVIKKERGRSFFCSTIDFVYIICYIKLIGDKIMVKSWKNEVHGLKFVNFQSVDSVMENLKFNILKRELESWGKRSTGILDFVGRHCGIIVSNYRENTYFIFDDLSHFIEKVISSIPAQFLASTIHDIRQEWGEFHPPYTAFFAPLKWR